MIKKNIPIKFQPLLISGGSGAGKGTIIKNLLQLFPELFQFSVNYTTRSPRPGEINGKDYHFVSKSQYQKVVNKGDFLLNYEYCANFYMTSKSSIQSIIAKGKICLLDIDVDRAEQIYQKYPKWNYVYFKPPSLEILEARLRGRATQSEESIRLRLATASKQLAKLGSLHFYEVITNDFMEDFYQTIIKFINNRYELLIELQT